MVNAGEYRSSHGCRFMRSLWQNKTTRKIDWFFSLHIRTSRVVSWFTATKAQAGSSRSAGTVAVTKLAHPRPTAVYLSLIFANYDYVHVAKRMLGSFDDFIMILSCPSLYQRLDPPLRSFYCYLGYVIRGNSRVTRYADGFFVLTWIVGRYTKYRQILNNFVI